MRQFLLVGLLAFCASCSTDVPQQAASVQPVSNARSVDCATNNSTVNVWTQMEEPTGKVYGHFSGTFDAQPNSYLEVQFAYSDKLDWTIFDRGYSWNGVYTSEWSFIDQQYTQQCRRPLYLMWRSRVIRGSDAPTCPNTQTEFNTGYVAAPRRFCATVGPTPPPQE